MTAILGRMAAYSGKELEWKTALGSQVELFPKVLAWDADPGPKPGENGSNGSANGNGHSSDRLAARSKASAGS